MKVRHKETKQEGWSNKFNSYGIGEIIIQYDSGETDSDYMKNYEVQLTTGVWVSFSTAFRNNLVITDNYGYNFREPKTVEEKQKGWYE